MPRGIFFLVAGPAGVGKTTLLQPFVATEKNLVKAISVTTRPPRRDEKDGVDYHFWDDARFDAAVGKGEFLEHALVHGLKYGTLEKFVEEKLTAGVDVVKDIDVQGVHQIRRIERFWYPHSVAVFVMPPSREELERRLRGRRSEDAERLAVRMKNAEDEMKRIGEYEYVVVNDSVEHTLEQLRAIRVAEHCRRERWKEW
ncbi:MAG TPA: guanylate kinase [Planctomycetota bacterium]|nr:guanylate kinase [Planctomycetota bacterium]